MKHILALLVFLITSWSHAQGAGTCLPESDVKSLQQNFSFQAVVPGTRTTTAVKSLPACDDGSMEFKTVQGLLHLRTLQQTIKGSSQTSVLSQEGIFNFFKKRVQTIVFGVEENCPLYTAAFYSLELSHTIFICPHFVNTESVLMAALFLAHEARHADVDHHSVCKEGPARYVPEFLNREGCDQSVDEQGSYGAVTKYWWDLSQNATEESLRKTAKSNFKKDLRERYNQKSFKSTSGALFLSEQNQLYFFDGVNMQPYKGYVPTGPVTIVDRVGLPSVFEHSSGRLKVYEFEKEWVEKAGAISKDFAAKTASERTNLLDVIYADEMICFLYKPSLKCFSRNSGESIEIGLQRLRPLSLKMMDGKYLVLVDTQGAPYDIPDFSTLQQYKENALTPVRGVSRVKTISQTVFGAGIGIGVDPDGKAVLLNPKTGWEPIKSAGRLKFKKVISVEFSEELEKL